MNAIDLQREHQSARDFLLRHEFARALACYEGLVRKAPGSSVIWFEYGNAASGLHKLDLAATAWNRAIELAPNNAELVAMVGHRYQGLRWPVQARDHFRRAAAADPRAINPRISLAVLLEQSHQLAGARQAVEECLAIEPRDDQARYFQAVLDRREGHLAQAETRLRELLSSEPKHPYVRYACRYELAQVLDRTERFDEAMQFLLEAKRLVRSLTDTELLLRGYDVNAQSARRFTESQPRDIFQTWANFFPENKREVQRPIAFLGGHPQSGTTLLEQILDAHPKIAALDEPTAFLDVLHPAFLKSKEHSSARLNALRRAYFEAIDRELGGPSQSKMVIDKNPSPTARLPIWLRVFPELRIIIALRDPRDVILSCFFQNIPLNAVNVNFLSFERLAKHYRDLMDIWFTVREWPGFHWIEARYEDIVAGLEKEGGRVTRFLGLEWDEQQKEFYAKSRQKQMYSPTYQDVTRPVYTRSIARWRAYEKHLAPILPQLKPYWERLGYDV
jgi:tetratricopeptide (TPR) repeat protein